MISNKVTVTYFKMNGKYYTDANFNVSDKCVINDGTCLSMNRVIDEYNLIITREENAPGLSSDAGEFYKVFTADDGYPVMVKPRYE